MACGDHTVEIPATDKKKKGRNRPDGASGSDLKENMIKAKELAAKEAEAISARVARAARVNDLTARFDSDISSVLKSVASASTELQACHGVVDDRDSRRNKHDPAPTVAAATGEPK